MVSSLFHTFVYTPLYNALILLLDIGPWVALGVAVVVLTVVVKFALFPFSLKASKTQRVMKGLEEEMKEIKDKYKDDKEKQGRELLELYKKNNVNPFSSFIVMFIQLPIVLGLYYVFLRGGLPNVDTSLLYSFVPEPKSISMFFLGIVDMSEKNIFLAVLAGISQHFQVRLAMPPIKQKNEGKSTFQEEFAKSLQIQMKYVLPFVIMFVAYVASSAVALYWITSNIFAIAQEMKVKRHVEVERIKNENK